MTEPKRSDFATYLLNDKHLQELIDIFIGHAVTEAQADIQDDRACKFIKFWLEQTCGEGFKVIVGKSESPLERVFLAALMLGFIKWSPMSFVWTPAFGTDAPTVLSTYRAEHVEAMAAVTAFTTSGKGSTQDLITLLMAKDSPVPDAGVLLRHVMEDMFQTWDAFHLTLQPKFTSIRIDGRQFRADALIWIPANPVFNVVLECDGFDYHSDKAKFTSDRRRDRVLAANGYKVMRFSGAEVFEDPISTASEAFEFLESQRGSAST